MPENLLHQAILKIKSVCDGAKIHDGLGFNKPDADFINHITYLPFDRWGDTEKYEAYIRIKKYAIQLKELFNIDINDIPKPNKPITKYVKRDINVIDYNSNKFIIKFTYNPVLVDLIKTLDYNLRTWNPVNKSWDIIYNNTTIAFIKKLINEYGFEFIYDDKSILNTNEETIIKSNTIINKEKITIVEKNDSVLFFSFQYNDNFVKICKALNGKFIKNTKRIGWEIPISIENIGKIIELLNTDSVNIEPDLYNKLLNKKDEMKSLYSLSFKESTNIDIKNINPKLYSYQLAGVEYALKAKRCIIADEMGLGKSIQALSAFIASNSKRLLVICPKSLKYMWYDQVKTWYPEKSVQIIDKKDFDPENVADICITNYDSIISRKKSFKTLEEAYNFITESGNNLLSYITDNKDIYEIKSIIDNALKIYNGYIEENVKKKNIEKLIKKLNTFGDIYYDISKDIEKIDYDFIVFDESHYLKNTKASRTKSAINLAKDKEYRLLLTGTPVINRPVELVSQLTILDKLTSFGGFFKFVTDFCNAHYVEYGRHRFLDVTGASNLKKLNEDLRKLCYIRREKKQVLELPEEITNFIPVDIDNRIEYNKAENEFFDWYKENINNMANINLSDYESIVKLTYLRQIVALGKISSILEFVDDFFENNENEKLVIFAHHKKVIEKLLKGLTKYNPVSIYGDINEKDRNLAVENFQNDNVTKIIIGNLAMSEGLTLTRASNLLFCEYFYTWSQHNQSTSRIYRISQKNNVSYYYFTGVNTIDDYMIDMVKYKRNITDIISSGFLKEKIGRL